MTMKVTCKARFAGRRSSSKCRGRDEMDGQFEGRECGMQSSQWSPRKRCGVDNAKRWAQPVRFHEDYEPGVSKIISRKARRHSNYRTRSEHCKCGSKIALRHAALPE